MASQITGVTIVYSTVYSRCWSKKTSKLHVTGLCEGNPPVTGEFPAQRASNAENVSIWWRHHVFVCFEVWGRYLWSGNIYSLTFIATGATFYSKVLYQVSMAQCIPSALAMQILQSCSKPSISPGKWKWCPLLLKRSWRREIKRLQWTVTLILLQSQLNEAQWYTSENCDHPHHLECCVCLNAIAHEAHRCMFAHFRPPALLSTMPCFCCRPQCRNSASIISNTKSEEKCCRHLDRHF